MTAVGGTLHPFATREMYTRSDTESIHNTDLKVRGSKVLSTVFNAHARSDFRDSNEKTFYVETSVPSFADKKNLRSISLKIIQSSFSNLM